MDAGVTQTNVQNREPSQVQEALGRAMAALAHLEHGQRDAMDELRVALCAYVGALRAEGASREATLASVRDLVTSPASSDRGPALPPIVREALAELSLEWCEAEYDRMDGEG